MSNLQLLAQVEMLKKSIKSNHESYLNLLADYDHMKSKYGDSLDLIEGIYESLNRDYYSVVEIDDIIRDILKNIIDFMKDS